MLIRSLVFCGILFAASGLQAQQPAVGAVPGPPSAGVPQTRVTAVTASHRSHPQQAALGDIVTVNVEGLSSLLAPGSQVQCKDLILFLNEIAILGNPPESCNLVSGKVRFLLDRTDKSDRAWHALLSEPTHFSKEVSVTVGLSENIVFSTNVQSFELLVLPEFELFCYLGVLAVGLVGFVRLAQKTSLLRDPVTVPDGKKAPYSLARFQLAFWTFLVIAAYVFIWMVTSELDTITGSVLVLLGIGSGTALGAVMIDGSKLAVAEVAAEAAPPPTPRLSRGFINDLLADSFGVNIYHFQLFAWTLILGVIFWVSVYDGLQMPQFSTTLLGLMGLSSGTYLGFKLPEKAGS